MQFESIQAFVVSRFYFSIQSSKFKVLSFRSRFQPSSDLMRIRLALPEEALSDPGALLPELWAEGAVDDDVDGRVEDEEQVADARQVVRPLRKRLHAATVIQNIFLNWTLMICIVLKGHCFIKDSELLYVRSKCK